MLEKILSVSGKSGLFELLSQGKNTLIAENLLDKKRIPIHARDKVVSLKDITMYTTESDVPLSEVLQKVYKKYNGQKIEEQIIVNKNLLLKEMAEILPNFDKNNVYPSDIKKLFSWYNILVSVGYTEFSDKTLDK